MPTFEYECKEHGVFEVFFEERENHQPCKICGAPSEFRWSCPNIDPFAFKAWADEGNSGFSDKSKYRDHVMRSGSTPYEPGMDQDAKQNNERILKDMENDFRENVIGPYIQGHTIDELHGKIAAEKTLMEAQRRGDVDTIRKMGALPSLDDAMKNAPETPVQEVEYYVKTK